MQPPRDSPQAGINQTTPCLPSSKASDHADSLEAADQSASRLRGWKVRRRGMIRHAA